MKKKTDYKSPNPILPLRLPLRLPLIVFSSQTQWEVGFYRQLFCGFSPGKCTWGLKADYLLTVTVSMDKQKKGSRRETKVLDWYRFSNVYELIQKSRRHLKRFFKVLLVLQYIYNISRDSKWIIFTFVHCSRTKLKIHMCSRKSPIIFCYTRIVINSHKKVAKVVGAFWVGQNFSNG